MTFIKNKIKLIIFFLIFIVISPIIISYAKGDVFMNGWNILQTGGVYVTKEPIGSEVFLNSKSRGVTSFFTRDILIKNLRLGTYEIKVEKAGYNTWLGKIKVYSNLVSDANVFMLPEKVETREILKYISKDIGSTTTKSTKISNPEYADVLKIFTATSSVKNTYKSTATSTVDLKSNLGTVKAPIMNNKLGLWKETNKIFIQWFGKNESAPKYLCDEMFDCMKKSLVTELPKEASRVNFLPGYDAVIFSIDNSIFAVQTESNQYKKMQPIYLGTKPDFRINDGSVFIKDGTKIFEIVL